MLTECLLLDGDGWDWTGVAAGFVHSCSQSYVQSRCLDFHAYQSKDDNIKAKGNVTIEADIEISSSSLPNPVWPAEVHFVEQCRPLVDSLEDVRVQEQSHSTRSAQ